MSPKNSFHNDSQTRHFFCYLVITVGPAFHFIWLELSSPGPFPMTSLGSIEFLAEWKISTMLCSIGKLSGISLVLTKGQVIDDLYSTDTFHTCIGKCWALISNTAMYSLISRTLLRRNQLIHLIVSISYLFIKTYLPSICHCTIQI